MRRLIIAVIAAFGLLMLGTIPASATESPFTLDTGECGATTITTSASKGTLVVDADGDLQTGPVGTAIEVGPFVGDVEVYYRVFGGGERDDDLPLWNGHPATGSGLTNAEFIAEINAYEAEHGDGSWSWLNDPNPFVTWESVTVEGCTAVEALAPTAKDRTCEAPGFVIIPEVEGLQYFLDSDPHDDPTEIPVPPGTYQVTAEVEAGYVVEPEDADLVWEVVVEPELEACQGVPGRDGDDAKDGKDGKDGEDATPAAVPTKIPAGADELPKTGVNPVVLGLAGLLTAGGGAYMIYASRRPAREH